MDRTLVRDFLIFGVSFSFLCGLAIFALATVAALVSGLI